MLLSEHDGESFYKYAMELFFETGHVSTCEPEFTNHSPEQFVYFDNKGDVSLSRDQRTMFKLFINISRLFSANGCTFFSINLLTEKGDRSQVAHDIHTMIHPMIEAESTVCLFRYCDEVMLSFVGYGNRCILSDWYPIDDDYGRLPEKIDIANISIRSGVEYFSDMVYILARGYYLIGKNSSVYNLLPIDFVSKEGYDGIDRETIDQTVKEKLTEPERDYGEDYVEYDESVRVPMANIGAELDLMLLEMEDKDDNFDEVIEDSGDENDGLYVGDEYIDEAERDAYEFNSVNPEIFQNPLLMVKWLKNMDNDPDN